MEIAIHTGVHKTASTYIQNTLKLNQQLLSRHEVSYIPLQALRNSITTNSAITIPQLNKSYDFLKKQYGNKRMILSDENFIGFPAEILMRGQIYSKIGQRLAKLRHAISPDEAHVFFSIRNYESFIPSIYVELLRHKPFFSFEEFTSNFNIFDISWHSIVDNVCREFQQDKITLWDYDEFRNIEKDVFDKLIGLELPIRKLAYPVRQSLSAKAIAALGALRAVLNDNEIRQFVQPMNEKFPKCEKNPAFMPFPEDTAMRLRERFAADMVRIRTDFPHINWLGLPGH